MNNNAPIFSLLQFFADPTTASNTVVGIVKLAILFAIGLYLVFCVVVIRQVTLMSRTVSTPIDGMLKLISYLHLAAAGAVWWMAFTLL